MPGTPTIHQPDASPEPKAQPSAKAEQTEPVTRRSALKIIKLAVDSDPINPAIQDKPELPFGHRQAG